MRLGVFLSACVFASRYAAGQAAAVDAPAAALREVHRLLGPGQCFAGRLSADLPFAPWRLPPGSPAPRSDQGFDGSAYAHAHSLAASGTAAVAGQLALVEGAFESAVALLTNLAEDDPASAQAWSDLAVAYVSRATGAGQVSRGAPAHCTRHDDTRDPYDAVRALDAAERAVQLDPGRAPALFNRALARDALHLVDAARDAWLAYLDADPDSPWAEEARRRIEALDLAAAGVTDGAPEPGALARRLLAGDGAAEALFARFPHIARRAAQEHVFAAWADAEAGGDRTRAEAALGALRRIGDVLAERQSDRLVADAVAAVDAASKAGDDALATLVRGQLALCDGTRAYESDRLQEAITLLRQARAGLAAGGSPLERLAAFNLGRAHYYAGETASSKQVLTQLLAQTGWDAYPHLHAHVLRCVGLLRKLADDKLDEALRLYRQAEALLRRTGDDEWLAHIVYLEAEALTDLGLPEEAWRARLDALQRVRPHASPARRFPVLWDTAETLQAEGWTRVAPVAYDEQVREARKGDDAYSRALALLARGGQRQRLGREAEAAADFGAARDEAARIRDAGLQQRLVAHLGLVESASQAWTDPRMALDGLLRAQAIFDVLGLHHEDDAVALGAAAAERARGDGEAAEQYLARALDVRQAQSREIDDESLRITHARAVAAVVDLLLELRLVLGRDARQLLETAERGKARALAASLARRDAERLPPEAFDLARLQRELGPNRVAVAFHVAPTRLFAWIVDAKGVKLLTADVDAAALHDEVTGLVRALDPRGGGADWLARARRLHARLLAPVLRHLRPGTALVIVPHRFLHALPFAALHDVRGRFVIEDHALTIAPSLTVWRDCRARAADRAGAPLRRALVVGDPAFSARRFPGLERLAHAAGEASAVAALYPEAKRLDGREATAARILDGLDGAELFHYAGHAVIGEHGPASSRLVTAEPADADVSLSGDPALGALDLARLRLPDARLVVLSACRTAAGHDYEGEGVSSLARWFLAAGAPAVVATLWSVVDDEAREVVVSFHRHLRAGKDAAEALRAAQVEALQRAAANGSRNPTWPAFVLVGAD
jgi:CHAT domain-containing protein/tetratricopeptide (TPR) repeat protein